MEEVPEINSDNNQYKKIEENDVYVIKETLTNEQPPNEKDNKDNVTYSQNGEEFDRKLEELKDNINVLNNENRTEEVPQSFITPLNDQSQENKEIEEENRNEYNILPKEGESDKEICGSSVWPNNTKENKETPGQNLIEKECYNCVKNGENTQEANENCRIITENPDNFSKLQNSCDFYNKNNSSLNTNHPTNPSNMTEDNTEAKTYTNTPNRGEGQEINPIYEKRTDNPYKNGIDENTGIKHDNFTEKNEYFVMNKEEKREKEILKYVSFVLPIIFLVFFYFNNKS